MRASTFYFKRKQNLIFLHNLGFQGMNLLRRGCQAQGSLGQFASQTGTSPTVQCQWHHPARTQCMLTLVFAMHAAHGAGMGHMLFMAHMLDLLLPECLLCSSLICYMHSKPQGWCVQCAGLDWQLALQGASMGQHTTPHQPGPSCWFQHSQIQTGPTASIWGQSGGVHRIHMCLKLHPSPQCCLKGMCCWVQPTHYMQFMWLGPGCEVGSATHGPDHMVPPHSRTSPWAICLIPTF